MPYYAKEQKISPAISSSSAQRDWLCRCDDDWVCIRKPHQERLINGVMSKGFSVVSPSLALLFLWLAGPQDLELDLRQRTYRYRSGFLYLAPTMKGTFEDIAAVGVEHWGSDTNPYRLLLIWQTPGRKNTFIAEYTTASAADARRTLLAEKLAL